MPKLFDIQVGFYEALVLKKSEIGKKGQST